MWYRRDKRKIPSVQFKPLGTDWPHSIASKREHVLENIAFFDRELVRWRDSVAWVNDGLRPLDKVITRHPLVDVLNDIATDSNAAAINEQLKYHLNAYNKVACYIANDLDAVRIITRTIDMSCLEASQNLLAIAGEDVAMLWQLKTMMHVARSGIQSTYIGKKTKIFSWTADDYAEEGREIADLRTKYLALKTEDSRQNASSPVAAPAISTVDD